MDGFVVASPGREKNSIGRFERFASDFRTRFGREPDSMAAMSYDAAQLLIETLCRAGGRPRHEVFPIKFSSPGVTGILTFDGQGNRMVNLELREVRDARFVCSDETGQGR
jgi:branched-chain amino acid transport system substrate-binding protein